MKIIVKGGGPKCPMCGNSNAESIAIIWKCKECGHIFVDWIQEKKEGE